MTTSKNGLLPKRKQGLTLRRLDGEVLVYDPETTRASCLNAFAADVLERCDGEHAPDEIARDLPFENTDPRVVLLALADLQKAELLEPDAAIDFPALTGPSRRDFFKRLGMATSIAVPVVAGMKMPAAAAAASGETCNEDTMPCGPGLKCVHRINPGSGNCDEPGNDCICVPK